MTNDPICKRCLGTELTLRWQRFENGTKHIRATCSGCGAYVTFLPQTQANLEKVSEEAEADIEVTRSSGQGGFLDLHP